MMKILSNIVSTNRNYTRTDLFMMISDVTTFEQKFRSTCFEGVKTVDSRHIQQVILNKFYAKLKEKKK